MLAAYDTTSVGREIASMAPKDAMRVLALLSAQDKGSLLSELSLAGLLDEAHSAKQDALARILQCSSPRMCQSVFIRAKQCKPVFISVNQCSSPKRSHPA